MNDQPFEKRIADWRDEAMSTPVQQPHVGLNPAPAVAHIRLVTVQEINEAVDLMHEMCSALLVALAKIEKMDRRHT